jgi:hypothetical protein
MSEKRIPIQITITGDRVDKLNDIWGELLPTKGTKKVINLELINSAIDKFHKKLFKPGDVIKTMGTPENE